MKEVFLVKTENFLITNKESTGLDDERVKWVQILWGTILSKILKIKQSLSVEQTTPFSLMKWDAPLYAVNIYFLLPLANKEATLAYGRAEYSQVGKSN